MQLMQKKSMKIYLPPKMLKDTFYSIIPINALLRIFALSNIYRKGTEVVECGSLTKSIIYVTILGLINLVFSYPKIKTFKGTTGNGLVKFSDSIQMTFWASYSQYVIDMYFIYKYGRNGLLEYLKAFDHIDSILGIPYYDKIRRTIFHTIIFSVAICLVTSVFDYGSWILVEGWEKATMYSIDYLYFFLNMLTVLDIISHVIQVEYRLKMIRDLLQDYENISIIKYDRRNNIHRDSANKNTQKSLHSLKILCHKRYLENAWFSKCYLLLHDQVAYVNLSYGYRVLAYCVNLLFNSINLLNLSIRTLNGSMKTRSGSTQLVLLPSISAAIRPLNYGVMAVILMYRCEQAYKECEKILSTLDLLLANQSNGSELKANLEEFRNLLITRPIKFHAAKFFTMDYTTLVSMGSVVVTYTIIMLQSMQ